MEVRVAAVLVVLVLCGGSALGGQNGPFVHRNFGKNKPHKHEEGESKGPACPLIAFNGTTLDAAAHCPVRGAVPFYCVPRESFCHRGVSVNMCLKPCRAVNQKGEEMQHAHVRKCKVANTVQIRMGKHGHLRCEDDSAAGVVDPESGVKFFFCDFRRFHPKKDQERVEDRPRDRQMLPDVCRAMRSHWECLGTPHHCRCKHGHRGPRCHRDKHRGHGRRRGHHGRKGHFKGRKGHHNGRKGHHRGRQGRNKGHHKKRRQESH